MAWEENSCISLNMQLIAILSRIGVYFKVDEKEMLTLWLADKILKDLDGEDELKLTAIETAKDELMDVNR